MIKTLLLSGANNHNWQLSTPFCKKLLEDTGLFEVDVTEDPSSTLEDKDGLAQYQLLFSDYNGPDWSAAAKANFVDAVSGGAGLVILHAADNAFPGWVEYETMAGLLWREGAGHGAQHRFKVTITDHDHPITAGLPDMEDHWDELYHNLTHMHNAPIRVLATAYSDPATRGTGKDEPMLVVSQYGAGRVFHNILGHVWKDGCMDAFEDPAFQRVLIRGCEWAAAGEATT